MKLRLLELTNVRRFGGRTARLGPFGDGLTTITAENEAGKSTFFDALHALFFLAHSSSAQDVRGLQPYSGGPVTIAADIELEGHPYRIEKTYLAQKSARVIDGVTQQIVKQQGDAEAWIDAQINQIGKGPAGLLWVRQGATEVDPQGKEGERSIAVRRDLMSSVRGQIDAVTGGRRMDKIVAQCRAELSALATAGFKPKANSAWKQLADQIDFLSTEQDRLAQDVAGLSRALEEKRRVQARLRALEDPEMRTVRDAQLSKAAEALAAAQQHNRHVEDASKAAQIAASHAQSSARQLKDITDLQERRADLARRKNAQQLEMADAKAKQKAADTALLATQEQIAEQDAQRRTLNAALKEARATERAAQKWARLRELAELRTQIDAPRARFAAAEALLAGGLIAQADLDRLTETSQRISIAAELRKARFACVTLHPLGAAQATLDGVALPAGTDLLIDRDMDLQMPGFGSVSLTPAGGASAQGEDPVALQAELDTDLLALGVETLAAARQAVSARQAALADKQIATAELRGLAPDGVGALDAEWDRLCAELGHPPQSPAPKRESRSAQAGQADRLDTALAQLDNDLAALRTDVTELQEVASEAGADVAHATGVLSHVGDELEALKAAPDEAAQMAALDTKLARAQEEETAAQEALEALQARAPDLELAQTEHDRLVSADQADRDEAHRLERDLARANGAIETQSEHAVEEKLAEVTAQLSKAQERSHRYALQARALDLLIRHLEAARRDAQDTYFEPIRRELMPLLAQLHPGAEFELDPDKMLVGKISRNGVTDDVSVLSGGAYEQIAILTRLAFARLFSKQGQHVPVILDDALVHTDDARISTMFNMLSQVAKDQQIIVLSCRTRAFSDLGGTRAFIETDGPR